MTSEDRFVEKLRAMLPGDPRVTLGPGDDAALVRSSDGDIAVTTDMLVEGVDFLPDEDPQKVGRRALAVNLSDLAAIGARPEFFLLSIGFSTEKGEEFPLAIARGALSRAGPLGVALAGGDLSSAPATVVSIALWGRVEGQPLLRSGGSDGDLIFLSGFPGRAAAGLCLARRLAAGQARPDGLQAEHERELLDAYRDPEPRVALGLALSQSRLASAAIDVSDGVGMDVARMARASGLRAVIEKERLPVSPALAAFAAIEKTDPVDWVLGGGDDYELLFTATERALAGLSTLVSGNVPITRVGHMEKGEGAVLRDGPRERDIASLGHDHFESRA